MRIMSLLMQFVTLMFLLNICKCEIVNCADDCSCVNQNELCTLKCSGWQQCYKNTLTCTSGQPCEVDCDEGDKSCEGATINANGATSLTVKCTNWRDCYNATVNCGTTPSCEVDCNVDGPNLICNQLNLNCGTSRCIIKCAGDANSDDSTCQDLNVDTSDPNIYSFKCVQDESLFPDACAMAPEEVLPPTQDPTNDPTLEPTTPTNTPSKTPTTPTLEPTHDPTNDPTQDPTQDPTIDPTNNPTVAPTIVVGEITIEIEVTDPDINEDEIEDLVDETTGKYLDTLFAESDYQLSVDIIKSDDKLIVNIIVSTNGDPIDLNEKEIIEQNEKEIKKEYGNKVRVSSDNKEDNGIEWYLFVILAVVIVLLIIIVVLLLYWKNKMKKKAIMNSEKHVEIGLTETKPTMSANDNKTNGGGEGIIKTNESDSTGENSDTDENLYTEHVTKGMDENDENGGPVLQRKGTDELYGAGSVNTIGNGLSQIETSDGNSLDEDSIEDVYGGGNVDRVQSTSQM